MVRPGLVLQRILVPPFDLQMKARAQEGSAGPWPAAWRAASRCLRTELVSQVPSHPLTQQSLSTLLFYVSIRQTLSACILPLRTCGLRSAFAKFLLMGQAGH